MQIFSSNQLFNLNLKALEEITLTNIIGIRKKEEGIFSISIIVSISKPLTTVPGYSIPRNPRAFKLLQSPTLWIV